VTSSRSNAVSPKTLPKNLDIISSFTDIKLELNNEAKVMANALIVKTYGEAIPALIA